jgi:hypothetical protein
MAQGGNEVRLRLVRLGDAPATNPGGEAFEFGLQDTRGELVAGVLRPDGKLGWDFTLTARPGLDPARPNFTGRFASGPADDRFVYLSWRSLPRGVWINRVKARLADIDWSLVRAAQAAGRPLVADLTGRSPGGGRKPVNWRVAEDRPEGEASRWP